jgi:hypothetical protein
MRILAYIVSGIGLAAAWPFALMMTGFAHDQEQVAAGVGFARSAMVVTLFAIPLVWVISLVAAMFVHYRMKVPTRPPAGDTDADLVKETNLRRATRARKEQLLNRCAAAPYVAAGLHLAAWGLLAIIAR